jgi:hypothetical protein
MADVKLARADAEIAGCYATMAHLRPYVAVDELVGRGRAQQAQGYRLACLEGGSQDNKDAVVESCLSLKIRAWSKLRNADFPLRSE